MEAEATARKPDNSYILTIALAVLVQAGAGIWWLASVDSRVSHNDFQIQIMAKDVTDNTDFRVRWPRGELGSLPDDSEQNMRLLQLEKQEDKVVNKIYNGDGIH